MPRDLVFGNGRFYLAMDRRGLIRELCWPVVGAPNHLAGRRIRLAIRRQSGWFCWLDDPGWRVDQWYCGDVGLTVWRGFGLTIVRRAAMGGQVAVLDYEIDLDEEMDFFQSQELRINETDIGDTCFYAPDIEQMVHFKMGVWVGFGGRGVGQKIDQVACGLSGIPEHEGTWRDAEDGHLAGKPIEQGSVDSTFGLRVEGKWQTTISVAESLESLGPHGEEDAIRVREDWIRAGVVAKGILAGKEPLPGRDGPEWLSPICERVVRANTGEGGRVIAAIDSDIMGVNRSNYAYVWMRDAVLTATALGERVDLPGFVPECDTGRFLWQKYHPTGYRGSTWHPHAGDGAFPYQMDETALLVSFAHNNQMVDSRIEGWLALLRESISEDGMPRPSWDLWEERFGVHFWTTATVAQAFFDAGETQAGQELVGAMSEHFHPVEGRIPRRVNDHVADASVLAGCLWCQHLRPAFLDRSVEMVEQHLLMSTNCRGVARYEGDYYCRIREGYPGNPWIICTMWLARAYWLQGRKDEADDLLVWAEDLASASGMLAEQYHPDTREPLSVSPLTWSHAEYLESARLIRG